MLRKSLFFFQQNATNLVSGDGGRKGLEQLIPQLQVFMETFFSEDITILVVIYCNGELSRYSVQIIHDYDCKLSINSVQIIHNFYCRYSVQIIHRSSFK